MRRAHRVMVIGGSGAGKSTLAQQIGARLDLPVVHLDALFWKSGWVESDKVEFAERLRVLYTADRWVIDGNYSTTWPERLARAEVVVFLDISRNRRLWRVLRRIVRGFGKTRPDMAPGCPERLDWGFLRWVAEYDRRGRDAALELVRSPPGQVTAHHLRSNSEIQQFLAELPESRT